MMGDEPAMSLSEFNLIERYFTGRGPRRDDVVLGVGDDCALLRVPGGMELAVSIDTLVAGVHFPEDTPPAAIGHKALAVGLSDLAAMGALPAWATLSISLPRVDEAWLEPFAAGLFALAEAHDVALVGGDTVRGPLVITLQLHGHVPAGTALRRGGARAGDLIYVTGTLGDAGLGLAVAQGRIAPPADDARYLRGRLDRPQPRCETGIALRGLASSCIDISDGLAADLGHILDASGVGARLELARLPSSPELRRHGDETQAWRLALSAGDDYELCFTVPPAHAAEWERRSAGQACGSTRIGLIEAAPGLRLQRPDGSLLPLAHAGYDHFDDAGMQP